MKCAECNGPLYDCASYTLCAFCRPSIGGKTYKIEFDFGTHSITFTECAQSKFNALLFASQTCAKLYDFSECKGIKIT